MHFNRSSAFIAHLIVSLLVFSTLVLTMYFFWFPGELFFLDGGIEGLKLVAMVDLVLGPLLTLLLIKPGKSKKMLTLDMSVIVLFQLSALGYGFYTTYHQHTAAVVFAEDKFNTLSIAAYNEASEQLIERELVPVELDKFDSNPYPYHIYTTKPVGKSMGRFIADLLNGYPEAHERSDKYLPMAKNYDEMRESRIKKEKLEDDGHWAQVEAELIKHQHSLDTFDLYHFTARYGQGVAVFDPEQMRIVDYIELDKKETEAVAETGPENAVKPSDQKAEAVIE